MIEIARGYGMVITPRTGLRSRNIAGWPNDHQSWATVYRSPSPIGTIASWKKHVPSFRHSLVPWFYDSWRLVYPCHRVLVKKKKKKDSLQGAHHPSSTLCSPCSGIRMCTLDTGPRAPSGREPLGLVCIAIAIPNCACDPHPPPPTRSAGAAPAHCLPCCGSECPCVAGAPGGGHRSRDSGVAVLKSGQIKTPSTDKLFPN